MIDSATLQRDRSHCVSDHAPPTVDVGATPSRCRRQPGHPHRVRDHDRRAERVVGVRREHLQRDHADRDAARSATSTGDPVRPKRRPRSTPPTNTLYTANFDNTVSAFDLRHCNAERPGRLRHRDARDRDPVPGSRLRARHLWVAVDAAATHRLRRLPEGRRAARDRHEQVQRQPSGGVRNAQPTGDPHRHRPRDRSVSTRTTQTLYTANQVDNDVSVIDASRCNAQTRSAAVGIPRPPFRSRHRRARRRSGGRTRLYVTSGANAVAMINTSSCNAAPAVRMRPDARRP